jgi:hypothetical protein
MITWKSSADRQKNKRIRIDTRHDEIIKNKEKGNARQTTTTAT